MDTSKVPISGLNLKRELEKIPCNLCGSSSFRIVYPARYGEEKDRDLVSKFRASGDELLFDQLVACNNCGLKYVSPRTKGSIIVEAYSAGEDPLFVSQAKAREITFSQSLADIEKYVKKKGNVLDIGTAGGSFLAAAKKRGWTTYGCEPNRWLANWGNKNYGLNIKSGTIFDQKYKNDFFDLVTLWDVIEHTPDPMAVLKECNRVLKENGTLVVNYPDIGSWIARIMGRKWLFLTSVHLFYFTRRSIEQMLRKAGFEVLVIRPHFQKLQLDYVLFRGATYNRFASVVGRKMAKILGIGDRQVPYWLGQTFVIARKRTS